MPLPCLWVHWFCLLLHLVSLNHFTEYLSLITEFFSCVICLLLFYLFSFLKFSLCLWIFLQTSVSIFITIILNSLSGKLPISISSRSASEVFILYFCLEIISLFLHFPWFFCVSFYAIDKTATFPRQEGVVLCRRRNLLFSPALVAVL